MLVENLPSKKKNKSTTRIILNQNDSAKFALYWPGELRKNYCRPLQSLLLISHSYDGRFLSRLIIPHNRDNHRLPIVVFDLELHNLVLQQAHPIDPRACLGVQERVLSMEYV